MTENMIEVEIPLESIIAEPEDTSCHAKLSTGECECKQLAPINQRIWTVCAVCGHTEQLHWEINYTTKR